LRKIKTAVIGTGFIGPAHIEALNRIGGVEVLLQLHQAMILVQEVCPEIFIPKVYNTWQEVIEDKEVEVIHNCTPNHLHYEINKAAIEAGKHIISEKPLLLLLRNLQS
jgi:predicted dehydrogenase